jgi:hypothetical protein
MMGQSRAIRPSAARLKDLYGELDELNRNTRQKLKAQYPTLILPDDKIQPAEGWLLVLHLALPEDEIRSLFCIYGLIVAIRRGHGTKDHFLLFEDDEQVEAVLAAEKRLNVAGSRVDCYRISRPPD